MDVIKMSGSSGQTGQVFALPLLANLCIVLQ